MDPKHSAADGGQQSTTDAEPDVQGGEGGAPSTPARPAQRTATGPDQETIDKLIARGAKVARRDLNETIAKKYGKALDDVLADYEERIARDAEKDAKVEGEKEKSQREIERERKQRAAVEEKLANFTNKLKAKTIDGTASDVLAKMHPANDAARKLLAREVRDRLHVEIDDKGELEVSYLDANGKPSDALTADLLAAELAEALPMLVAQRTGTGAGLGVQVTTPEAKATRTQPHGSGAGMNGDEKAIKVGTRVVPVFSPADNVGALGKLLGQEK